MANSLIAFCGLYCGACSFKLAADEDNILHIKAMPEYYDKYKNEIPEKCPGCRLENKCGQCAIRDYATVRLLDYCSQCADFPCNKLMDFNNDGKPHHGEAISNLNLLKQIGEYKWIEHMKTKWTGKCGKMMSWYYDPCTHIDEKN